MRTKLVLAPSLGTTCTTCWGPTLSVLGDALDVVCFELPGHGAARGPVPDQLRMADLAAMVLDAVDGPFLVGGDSVGGQIALQLLLDAPERVIGGVLCCTGARIGGEETWRERAAQVRASGTGSLLAATARRWFAPDFLTREPERGSALLHALRDTDDAGYAAMCGALAAFDVHDRLGEIGVPVVAVAGAFDEVCPPDSLRAIAEGVQDGRLVVLDDVAHQAPAEDPESVARIILELTKELS